MHSAHPKSSPASAWTGTRFIFEIAERDSAASIAERDTASSHSTGRQDHTTTVDFRHAGYDETSEFFGFNNFAWGQVLQNLERLCESQEMSR